MMALPLCRTAQVRLTWRALVVVVAFLSLNLLWAPQLGGIARAQEASGPVAVTDPDLFADDDWAETESARVYVADPLEPVNRLFFNFNDKLYFWLIKPVSHGYAAVLPVPVREGIENFFFNLRTPGRLVNSLLQGKLRNSGEELSRFVINTTVGVAGIWDPARRWFNLKASDEDLGQTLGKYGFADGIYICWPFLGPSNLRDSVGLAGDYFLDPVNYLTMNNEARAALGVKAEETVNRTSLRLGDYEALLAGSFDPYSAIRDAYTQHRHSKINNDPEE